MNAQNIAQEEWIRWTPLGDLPTKCYINAIEVIADQLTIFLYNEKEACTISLKYKNNFYTYKTSEEICHIDFLDDIIIKCGKDLIFESRFFIVHNSSYIAWLVGQSGGLLQADNLQHYFILGATSVVDVIALQEPEVTITYNPPELSKD